MGYQVELSNGATINVPRDAARTKYEYISTYGIQAVLERARRTRAFKTTDDARIVAVITPRGERITQF